MNEYAFMNSDECNDFDDELHITDEGITRICDEYAIMRRWEEPLMVRQAEIVSQNGGDILEIGFGMGISANAIQEQPNIKSHTIVEIHPTILKEAHKFQQPYENVEIIPTGWWIAFKNGTLLNKKYDGVFYDAEFDESAYMFAKVAIQYLLKPNGIFTWYNNVVGKANEFALDCEYEKFELESFPKFDSSSGYTKNPYMFSRIIYIPIIKKGDK